MSKQANYSRKLALDSPDRKPSVFERLGTKSSVSSGKNVCRSWAQNGTCPLNKACKYAHTHVLISPSKRSKSETMKKQPVIIQKKNSKDDHKKLARSHQSSEPDWERWELGDLEGADEKALERRRQELQRELQLQMKKEKELIRKKDKKVDKKRARSSSSSSSSTTESSTSSTSSSSSSSEPRKRQNRKRKRASSSSDSEASAHVRRKSPKSVKVKANVSKKTTEKKDGKSAVETRNKSGVITKKSSGPKKSSSPGWERSRVRSPPPKQQSTKKSSPHRSPSDSKNKSPSPRYERTMSKNKTRTASPKQKIKEPSPKRTVKKVKESSVHGKERCSRQSPVKSRTSPPRVHKISPGRSRRHEETEKRRGHYDERKHSPRRERSREKERKREVRRGHSNEDDNGGLKKGGKILPLKPTSYTKESGVKPKDHKPSEKPSEKLKEDESDRGRTDREKEKNSKCERDKAKHKKVSDEHDRRANRDSDRGTARRERDRESERARLAKEREAERQKERDEALERCRERQRERDRLEKERKEKEEKKHHRDGNDSKSKDYERELPSLLDIKTENPRSHGESGNSSKSSDKHSQRDSRRNVEKSGEKSGNQERERMKMTPDKDHDRREPRRSDENERRQMDKDYESRRARDEVRHSSEARRTGVDERRRDDRGDSRRAWDDVRRVMDDRRRPLDPVLDDRRPHTMLRRPVDDQYDYRRSREESDLDVRDFPPDDRRRKLMHNFHHDAPDWKPKDPDLEYRDIEMRDEWNHPDRHHDWNPRYDHKWIDHEETRENNWNHYPRRPPEEWNNEWPQEEPPRVMYSEAEEEQIELRNEEYPEHNARRHNDVEPPHHIEASKEPEVQPPEEPPAQWDGNKNEGDALSDISDDPDDILNQDDEPAEESAPVEATPTSNQQIYVRSNDFFFDQKLECLGERALDFEEISDEELEEEARVSRGIMDVLGADWAGLVQQTRPRPIRVEGPGSAIKRWMIDRIVSRLGISFEYAGKGFVEKLIEKYKDFKKEEVTESNLEDDKKIIIKKESKEIVEEIIKKEPGEVAEKVEIAPEATETDELKPDAGIKLYHPVPGLHISIGEHQNLRSSLFLSHNRFKRALSARTDLALRRQLCNLSAKEPLHFTPPLDNKMYEASLLLYQKSQTMAVA